MRRAAMTLATLLAFVAPALAEKPICDESLKAFLNRMGSAGVKQLSGRELADITRNAIRGYESCTAGDERFDAKTFFEELPGQYGVRPEPPSK